MSSRNPSSIRQLSSSRLDSIDLLRGFACLWVTYCHAHGTWGLLANATGPLKAVTRFIGIGGKGVDLFVVVSGFCLFYPVLQRSQANLPQHSTLEFYRRRLNRICPVYYSAIVFALAVIGVGFRHADNRGLADLWPYALFVQNMMPDYIARVNGPLWSVALEMQLYLLFPVFAWILLRGKNLWLIAFTMLLSIAAAVAARQNAFAGRAFDPSMTHALPARAIQFVLGMTAASICVHQRRRWRAALYALTPPAIVVGLMSVSRSQEANPIGHLGLTAWGVIGTASVVALIELDHARGHIPKVLIPLQRIGLISFSVYVVHFPIMLALQPYLSPLVHGPLQAILLFTLTGLPLTLALSVMLFLFVERYTLNFRKREVPARTSDVVATTAPSTPDAARLAEAMF